MNSTVRMKASDIYKDWHVIDAAGRSLGRVATEAATLLRGKHKPTFEPHLDGGDFVIVVNASKVVLTGRKSEQSFYYTHSGYPGGLRSRSYAEQLARFPDRVIEAAVKGMLPKGPLGKAIAKHLKVYAGPDHPHQSQVTGSERARAVRLATDAEQLLVAKKPPRLRPLSVPDEPPVAVVAPPAAPPPAPAVKRARRAAPEKAVAEAPAPAAEVPVAAPVEAPAAEPPRKRAPRKKAEVIAETAGAPAEEAAAPADEAPKKPARRRAAKQEE